MEGDQSDDFMLGYLLGSVPLLGRTLVRYTVISKPADDISTEGFTSIKGWLRLNED